MVPSGSGPPVRHAKARPTANHSPTRCARMPGRWTGFRPVKPSRLPPVASSRCDPQLGTPFDSNIRSATTKCRAKRAKFGIVAREILNVAAEVLRCMATRHPVEPVHRPLVPGAPVRPVTVINARLTRSEGSRNGIHFPLESFPRTAPSQRWCRWHQRPRRLSKLWFSCRMTTMCRIGLTGGAARSDPAVATANSASVRTATSAGTQTLAPGRSP